MGWALAIGLKESKKEGVHYGPSVEDRSAMGWTHPEAGPTGWERPTLSLVPGFTYLELGMAPRTPLRTAEIIITGRQGHTVQEYDKYPTTPGTPP
ncbi:MAG: hypothetical protein V3U51_05280 [Thermoplasmata archaeon]